jgi:hypothetical protein
MEDDPALTVAADDAVAVDDIADADDSPYTVNATQVVDVLLFVQYFHHWLPLSQRMYSLEEHPCRHYTHGAVQHHGVNANIAPDYVSCALAGSHGTTRSLRYEMESFSVAEFFKNGFYMDM